LIGGGPKKEEEDVPCRSTQSKSGVSAEFAWKKNKGRDGKNEASRLRGARSRGGNAIEEKILTKKDVVL